MRVFVGVDPRDAVSYNVLRWSIERRSTRPVSVTPLILPQLGLKRRGLTDFTYTRYLVPALCGYQGRALFLDSDMLCLGNIAALFEMEFSESVAVVQHEMRLEWPSLMLFNNDKCKRLTRTEVETGKPESFEWADGIAALPAEWNHLVGYDEPKDEVYMVHFTMGTPGFKELRNCEYAESWRSELESMQSQCAWLELHGKSVHRDRVLEALNSGA